MCASKPLLEWRGRPLVAWALDAALASGLAPVVVVVGYRADEVRAALSRASQSSRTYVGVNSEMLATVAVVENPEWEEGIASSLRAIWHLATALEVPFGALLANTMLSRGADPDFRIQRAGRAGVGQDG